LQGFASATLDPEFLARKPVSVSGRFSGALSGALRSRRPASHQGTLYRRCSARPAGTRTVVWYWASPTWSRTRSSAVEPAAAAAGAIGVQPDPPQPGSAPGARVWACRSSGAQATRALGCAA
jgi:hypothetical protein